VQTYQQTKQYKQVFESRVLSTGVRAYFRQDLACAMCLSEEAPGKPPEASGKTYGYGIRRLTESGRKEPEAAGRPRPGGLRQASSAFRVASKDP
jgi:hypothetical protein